MTLGNSRPEFSIGGQRRIRPVRHSIKSRNAHPNFQTRRNSPNSLHNFAQESRAIFKTPPVLPFPRMRPKKFMPQISMTMFHINKIKTQLRSHAPSRMKVFNDSFDLAIRKQRKIGRQTKPPVQNRMPMQNPRLRARMGIGLAVPPRMRKLQPD